LSLLTSNRMLICIERGQSRLSNGCMKDGVGVSFVLAGDFGSPNESFRIPIGTERLCGSWDGVMYLALV
jgi:hypothetical protein